MFNSITNANVNALEPRPEILQGKKLAPEILRGNLEKALGNLQSAYESVCGIDSKLFRPTPVDPVNKPVDDDASLEALIEKINLLAFALCDDLCRIKERI